MVANAAESHLVSTLGWVDRGAVSLWETRLDRTRSIVIDPDAHFLSLHEGAGDYFAAVHHYEGDRLVISARPIADPEQCSARVVIEGGRSRFEGSDDAWKALPRAYTAWYGEGREGDFSLFLLDAPNQPVEIQR